MSFSAGIDPEACRCIIRGFQAHICVLLAACVCVIDTVMPGVLWHYLLQRICVTVFLLLARLLSDTVCCRYFSGFADICHLQRLAIINAQRLHCLSEHMPEALTHLSIAGCPELQIRASVLERLSRLKQLSIEGCPSTYLFIPDSISCCMALTQLRIRGCPGLQRLPEELKNLSSLVELNITRCFNLNCLPSGFGPGKRCQPNSDIIPYHESHSIIQ